MQENQMNKFGGSLKISHDVVASIAEYTVTEMEGVASLAPVVSSPSLSWFLEKQTVKPVSIVLSDGVAVIDIRIYVRNGVKIPELAKKLQANVKEAVQNMTGIVVSKVNLHIAGIAFSDEAAAV